MARVTEIKWAALISGRNDLVKLGRKSQTCQLLVTAGRDFVFVGGEEDIKTFSLSTFSFLDGRRSEKYRVALILRRYSPEVSPAETRIALRWGHSRIPLPEKRLRILFVFNPEQIYARIPVVDGSGDVVSDTWQALKSAPVKVSRQGKIFTITPKELSPRRIAHLSRAYVPRQIRSSRWRRTRRSFDTYNDVTTPLANPQLGVKLLRNATESQASAYAETAPYSYTAFYRSVSSIKTPNFRKLHRHELPNNPVTIRIVKVDEAQGFKYAELLPAKAVWGWTVSATLGFLWAGDEVVGPSHDANATNAALAKIADKAFIGVQANHAQNIVQYRQLVRLFRSTTSRFKFAIGALMNKDFRGAENALLTGRNFSKFLRVGPELSRTKTLAQNWLELQYAWKPMLQDIQKSIEVFSRYVAADPVSFDVSASATKTITRRTNKLRLVPYPLAASNSSSNKSFYDEVIRSTCKIGIRFKMDNAQKFYLSQFGFTNPINLAWEILPFSFVYDWMHPLGPYFESFSQFDGLVFAGGYQTNFTRVESHARIRFDGNYTDGPNQWYSKAGGGYDRDDILFNRVVLTTFPKGRFPRMKSPFSATHFANGLALLRTVFAKR